MRTNAALSLLALCILALLSACGSTKPAATTAAPAAPEPPAPPTGPTARLHDVWALDRLGDEAYAPVDGLEHPTLELNLTDMRALGTDGCNRFTGSIMEVSATTLRIGPLAGTRKLCRVGRDVTDGFNDALAQTTSYRLGGGGLTLVGSGGEALAVLRHVD